METVIKYWMSSVILMLTNFCNFIIHTSMRPIDYFITLENFHPQLFLDYTLIVTLLVFCLIFYIYLNYQNKKILPLLNTILSKKYDEVAQQNVILVEKNKVLNNKLEEYVETTKITPFEKFQEIYPTGVNEFFIFWSDAIPPMPHCTNPNCFKELIFTYHQAEKCDTAWCSCQHFYYIIDIAYGTSQNLTFEEAIISVVKSIEEKKKITGDYIKEKSNVVPLFSKNSLDISE